MRETEIKILDIDKPRLVRRLHALGARKVFDGELHALFFDAKSGAVRKKKAVLRLRKEGPHAFLAFKLFVSDKNAKVRDEYETPVSDFARARKALPALGFHQTLEMKKHRTSYALDRVRVDIDRYKGDHAVVPEFLEIEGPSLREIHAFAKKLGYTKKDCKAWGTSNLIRHYSKNKKKK